MKQIMLRFSRKIVQVTKSTLIEFITLYLKELLLKNKKDDAAKELIENCIVGMRRLAC